MCPYIYYVRKVSFIALDIIRKAFWDGWREKKCHLSLLLGDVCLLKQGSRLVIQSPQFEMRVGSPVGYEEAGYLWGCQMPSSCSIGDPLNSRAAKDPVTQAGAKASFAVHATG